MMRRRSRYHYQSGVALIIVLVVLATISLLAVEVNDRVRFSSQRLINRTAAEQARWYAQGAVQLAQQQLDYAYRQGPEAINRLLNQPAHTYAIGTAGSNDQITLQLRSAQNCFNLNSLTPGPNQQTTLSMFRQLTELLGINETQHNQLTHRLLDWLDADSQRRLSGAEHNEYREQHSYSADYGLLSHISILAQIWPEYVNNTEAKTAPEIENLLSLLCIRNGDINTQLNINQLTAKQAVLISAVTNNAIRLDTAKALIQQRPSKGFDNREALRKHELLASLLLTEEQFRQFTTENNWADALIYVRFDNSQYMLKSTLYMQKNGATITSLELLNQ